MQKIIVQGQPQGKLRARHGKNFITGAPQTYTPEKTRAYEAHVAWSYKAQGGKHYGEQYVRLGVLAFYSIPQSWTKKGSSRHEREPCAPQSSLTPTTLSRQ